MVWQTKLRADSALRPYSSATLVTMPLNSSRFSPAWMASTSAPISSTSYLASDPGLVQLDRGVQRGLAAEGGQQRVGALLGDDLLDDRPG